MRAWYYRWAGDTPETVVNSCGHAIPDVEVRVVDGDNRPLAVGETGEIVARGYNIMQGYFEDEAATAEAIDAETVVDVQSGNPSVALREL